VSSSLNRIGRFAVLVALASPIGTPAYATTDPISAHGEMDIEDQTPKPAKSVDWFVAPIPISNPTIGSGLEAIGMVLYKLDAESPDSFTAVGGGYTSNHSWAGGAVEKLYFDADRFRITFGGGYGSINYNFYGIGNVQNNADISVPINQTVTGAFIDARMRVWNAVYLGLRYRYANVRTDVTLRPESPPLPTELDLASQGIGVVGSYDTRDTQFSPHSGTLIDFKSSFSVSESGADAAYQTYSLAYNHYQSIGSRGVLAARVSLCQASSATPFFDLCIFGMNSDLRGYEAGRYRDHFMATGQVEYRHAITARFGAVVFAGAGAVADNLASLGSSTALPSGGLGLRYLVAPKQGVSLSADYAWGRDSQGLYLYVGDAF
jgi:outer membrane protein assembly factor BamA